MTQAMASAASTRPDPPHGSMHLCCRRRRCVRCGRAVAAGGQCAAAAATRARPRASLVMPSDPLVCPPRPAVAVTALIPAPPSPQSRTGRSLIRPAPATASSQQPHCSDCISLSRGEPPWSKVLTLLTLVHTVTSEAARVRRGRDLCSNVTHVSPDLGMLQ